MYYRYAVIDTLTEMQEILGDYEKVKGQLETYEEQVIRLRNELTAAEEKLHTQKQVISNMKQVFFTHYAQMSSVSNHCYVLEKMCDKLGGDTVGTQYV